MKTEWTCDGTPQYCSGNWSDSVTWHSSAITSISACAGKYHRLIVVIVRDIGLRTAAVAAIPSHLSALCAQMKPTVPHNYPTIPGRRPQLMECLNCLSGAVSRRTPGRKSRSFASCNRPEITLCKASPNRLGTTSMCADYSLFYIFYLCSKMIYAYSSYCTEDPMK